MTEDILYSGRVKVIVPILNIAAFTISWPVSKVVITRDYIRLSYLWKKYVIKKSDIRYIEITNKLAMRGYYAKTAIGAKFFKIVPKMKDKKQLVFYAFYSIDKIIQSLKEGNYPTHSS